jgi:hypothetical protein
VGATTNAKGMVELDIEAFLAAIAAGELEADRLYEVRVRS